MKNNQSILFYLLSRIRASFTRRIKPASLYWSPIRSVKPLSTKVGFDRGTPIDRFYIELFMREYARDIHGVCLEVGDNRYTLTHGREKVERADVLDADTNNKKAAIIGDLRNLSQVIDNSYDCIILTHVLGLIDDYDSAIGTIHRILKKDGVLLYIGSCLPITREIEGAFWRFTRTGAEYIFKKRFGKDNVSVCTYGNVLIASSIMAGMAQEELENEELLYNDPHYPCIVAVRAVKK